MLQNHPRTVVCGIGTDVGKTVVSAILMAGSDAEYWKPVQCCMENEKGDTNRIQELVQCDPSRIHKPAYSFKSAGSPHLAAAKEKCEIDISTIQLPSTSRKLIIEGVGGVLVPLTERKTTMELFITMNASWIVVSNHYLGSINHTLLTVAALKHSGASIRGIIFNGIPNDINEKAILEQTNLPLLARLLPEPEMSAATIRRYADLWNYSNLTN